MSHVVTLRYSEPIVSMIKSYHHASKRSQASAFFKFFARTYPLNRQSLDETEFIQDPCSLAFPPVIHHITTSVRNNQGIARIHRCSNDYLR